MLAVDTSVLLTIFKGEADGAAWLARLQREAALRPLVACAVVWAEVRAFFRDDPSCREALVVRVSGIAG
jgi:predicted nucleic acid-binding protein